MKSRIYCRNMASHEIVIFSMPPQRLGLHFLMTKTPRLLTSKRKIFWFGAIRTLQQQIRKLWTLQPQHCKIQDNADIAA
ncbi:hypothetical protein [Prevotellamassilia timonensis]|uniref:hypothetical protein n=1 Tax=Prevotellamassilia timonensis TaxID=1852370 RepID=UPI003FEE8001